MAVDMQWPVAYADDPESAYRNEIPYPAVDAGGLYGAPRNGRIHRGYDFAPGIGWNVRAVADGRVFFRPPYMDNGDLDVPPGWAAGGRQVWIQHDGFISRYFHLNAVHQDTEGRYENGSFVSYRPQYYGGEGAPIKRGDYVGTVGTSGSNSNGSGFADGVYGAHLHLEIQLGTHDMSNTAIDPIPFIRERLAGGAPNPITENGDDMYLVKDKALGHYYLIGNQYIRHITSSNTVGNLRQAGVPYMEGNNGYTVENIGTAMGVPMHVAYRGSDGMIRNASSNNFGSGGLWTVERRIARLQGLTP